MLIWYFSNNLDIYDYVGKLPEQHFVVWLFSNPGDNILFLLLFNEPRVLKRFILYVYIFFFKQVGRLDKCVLAKLFSNPGEPGLSLKEHYNYWIIFFLIEARSCLKS